jgi:hypothetical protein
MFEKIKARLCAEADQWYKMWSSWLAIAWGAIVYAVVGDPTTLSQLIAMVPSQYRPLVPWFVAPLAAALPIIVHCLKQASLSKGDGQ